MRGNVHFTHIIASAIDAAMVDEDERADGTADTQPAAEEDRRTEQRCRHDAAVLGHHEDRPADAGVVGEVAGDELGLGLGQVERARG